MNKKKALMVFILVLTISVFFCSSVFADTGMQFQGTVSGRQENGTGTSITVFVVDLFPQFDASQVQWSGDSWMIQKEILVSIKLSNLTDETRVFYGVYPRVKFANGTTTLNQYFYLNGVTDIQNQNPDFFITFNDADTYLEIAPSAAYSYNGNVCIPANTVLQAIATIKFNVMLTVDAGQTPTQAYYSENSLSAVDFYGTYSSPVSGGEPLGSNQKTNSLLEDILSNLAGSSSTNQSITNDSNTLKTESDQIHTQEAAYYNQNAQAIQSTGLSNYQFSVSDGNGVAAVSSLFTSIWNSLGNWTSVYIFSLTLGLALTILRHSPSAISRLRYKAQNKGD